MNDQNLNQQTAAEDDDDIVLLEDESGAVTRFQFLELVNVDGNAYAILLPLDDDEEGAVVIVEVVDLDKETEHYDAVTDDALNQKIFERFKKEYADQYDFA